MSALMRIVRHVMRPILGKAALVLAALAILAVCGCSDPYAQRRNAHRVQQMRWVLDTYAAREEQCADNLSQTVQFIDETNILSGDLNHAYQTAVWLLH
jgi:hypothetical protein